MRECWLTMEVQILSFTTDTHPRVIGDFLAAPLVAAGDRSTRLAQILDRIIPHLPSHIDPDEFWLQATAGFLTVEAAVSFRTAWAEAYPRPSDPPRRMRTRGSVYVELPSTDPGDDSAGASSCPAQPPAGAPPRAVQRPRKVRRRF